MNFANIKKRDLSNICYSKYLKILKEKNGEVEKDYFTDETLSTINNNKKFSDINQELYYIHHDLENIYPFLSDKNTCLEYNHPFFAQKKENLTYCNLIEHTILHVLIYWENEKRYLYKKETDEIIIIDNSDVIKRKFITHLNSIFLKQSDIDEISNYLEKENYLYYDEFENPNNYEIKEIIKNCLIIKIIHSNNFKSSEVLASKDGKKFRIRNYEKINYHVKDTIDIIVKKRIDNDSKYFIIL